jgi:hypothetical protein
MFNYNFYKKEMMSIISLGLIILRRKLNNKDFDTILVSNFINKIRGYSIKNKNVFFGYYDKNPFSRDDKLILANVAPKDYHASYKNEKISVGYFHVNNPNKFIEIGKTNTWNWQQGCRLQWHPKKKNYIIYNKIVKGNYGSIIQDIITKKVIKEFKTPLYDVSSDGKLGLSLNFSRLHRLRKGYGYNNFIESIKSKLKNSPENEGVWRVDLTKDKKELIISLARLSKLNPTDSMLDACHYINHISIAPKGKKFLFFHLWEKNGERNSRAIISDINGEKIKVLDNKMTASHYSWKNNQDLLITFFDKLNGWEYILFDRNLNKEIIGYNLLKRDGHPSFFKNKNFILIDSYPDKFSNCNLSLYNYKFKKLIEITKVHARPVLNIDFRCDLHPRLSNDERIICIDNRNDSIRKMNLIFLKELDNFF